MNLLPPANELLLFISVGLTLLLIPISPELCTSA